MSCRLATSAKAATPAGLTVAPLGLPGVTSAIALVRGVIRASAVAACGSRSGPGSRYTGVTPFIRSHMS